ncbi:MAG: HU family DNA-binding protein [Planctomycetota bacterium]|nr:HU family DNA-binding protein [Planctomycetota bacterium]
MNKADLVDLVHGEAQASFESRAAAERAVNAVIAAIKRGVQKDKQVQLSGFGTFSVRSRKARNGRNPKTGAPIRIPASRTVGFKPGLQFKELL